MAKAIALAKLLINGNLASISAAQVVNAKTGKSLDDEIESILAQIANLSGAEVEQLKTDLSALKLTFETFMTGEDDDNGSLDRLKELVAAIAANRTTIDALLTDKAAIEALDAVIGRVTALEEKNWDILDGIGKTKPPEISFSMARN